MPHNRIADPLLHTYILSLADDIIKHHLPQACQPHGEACQAYQPLCCYSRGKTDIKLTHSPHDHVLKEEVYIGVGDGKKYKKPMARFYLVGWGVPLIICGITGGASLSQYSSSGSCFLSLAPAAGAILIPIVIIFSIHLFFLLNILNFSPHR